MKKISFGITVLLFLASFILQAQTKINDITFPNSFTAGKDQLVLNGGGTREKYWMDMYVSGLYLTAKSKDAAGIVAADASMCFRICIVSGLISSSKMSDGVQEGFEKSTGGKVAPYQVKIDQFKKAFSDPISKGDVFDIVYTEGKTSVYKKGTLKQEIEGFDFKKAMFGMWLGTDPVDEGMKKGLLGQD